MVRVSNTSNSLDREEGREEGGRGITKAEAAYTFILPPGTGNLK